MVIFVAGGIADLLQSLLIITTTSTRTCMKHADIGRHSGDTITHWDDFHPNTQWEYTLSWWWVVFHPWEVQLIFGLSLLSAWLLIRICFHLIHLIWSQTDQCASLAFIVRWPQWVRGMLTYRSSSWSPRSHCLSFNNSLFTHRNETCCVRSLLPPPCRGGSPVYCLQLWSLTHPQCQEWDINLSVSGDC